MAGRAERPSDFAPRLAQVEADPSRAVPVLSRAPRTRRRPRSRPTPRRRPMARARRAEPVSGVQRRGAAVRHERRAGLHRRAGERHPRGARDRPRARRVLRRPRRRRRVARDAGAIRDRMQEHASHPVVRYTQAIVNHGREAGASLAHPHAQLLGMPFVPGAILEEEAGFSRFEGNCLLCATAEAELGRRHSGRASTPSAALVVCPYWSGTPFEMLMIPKAARGAPHRDPRGRARRRSASCCATRCACCAISSVISRTTSSSTPRRSATTASSTGTRTSGRSS